MAELADAVDSKSTDASLVGSTPTPGTKILSEAERILPSIASAKEGQSKATDSTSKMLPAPIDPLDPNDEFRWLYAQSEAAADAIKKSLMKKYAESGEAKKLDALAEVVRRIDQQKLSRGQKKASNQSSEPIATSGRGSS